MDFEKLSGIKNNVCQSRKYEELAKDRYWNVEAPFQPSKTSYKIIRKVQGVSVCRESFVDHFLGHQENPSN